MSAFFGLDATKEFCAFYSVSFPQGITDDDAHTLWNIWQTRCRKEHNLKSFIWVSERQKNNTLHFHLLTNTRMPIKDVNGYMRTSLLPYCHLYGWNVDKIRKYNGVDVDNVWLPKRRKGVAASRRRPRADARAHLGKYLTKYVSKNKSTFTRLAWHQSRDISALFTAQNFDVSEKTDLLTFFNSTKENWKKFEYPFVSVYIHPTICDLTNYLQLEELNNNVWRILNEKNPP